MSELLTLHQMRRWIERGLKKSRVGVSSELIVHGKELKVFRVQLAINAMRMFVWEIVYLGGIYNRC